MVSQRGKNTNIKLILVFLLISVNSWSQSALVDSILDFYWYRNISYEFELTSYSAITGTDICKGSVVAYIDKDTQYRIRLDTLKNSNSVEYLGIECVKNKNKQIIGCNYSTDSTYANFERDRETFHQMLGLYQPDHIFAMDKFTKKFNNKKNFKVDVNRTGQNIIIKIIENIDTNSTSVSLTKNISSYYEYKVSKADYSVYSLKHYRDFKIDGTLFSDSSEMNFNNRTTSKEFKVRNKLFQYVFAFKPYKKVVSSREANHQRKVARFPDFILMDTLKELYRSSDIKSKYTLAEFWYKACLPCVTNIKRLNSIRDSFDVKFLEVIAVNDADILDSHMKRFIANYKPNHSLLFNGRYLRDELKVNAHPSTYIFNNKTRQVVFFRRGADKNYSEEIIAKLKTLK